MASKIGDLRHRITFEKLLRTSDGQGGWTESWEKVADCWAKIELKPAKERFFAERIEPQDYRLVTIRYRSDINEEMRIVFKDIIMQIKSIDRTDERRFWMLIDTQENVGT